MNDAHIATLRAERAAYVKAGLPDRVEQVDFELARYGASPEEPVKPVVKSAKKGTA